MQKIDTKKFYLVKNSEENRMTLSIVIYFLVVLSPFIECLFLFL